MEEIKVGEYIKTKRQVICKIDHINKNAPINRYWVNPDCDGWCNCVKTTDVLKHSFNLMDLIEVGDYVNGEKVINTWSGSRIETQRSNFDEEDIKTILTKEQYEKHCCKIEV